MASEQKTTRKLRAILSADVKGYSRLMSDDESYTIQTLKAYQNIMTTIIEKHYGRVVDSPGDNMLAEFSSIVNAVQSAVEIQNTLKQKNIDIPHDKKFEFRIGVNIGDVVQDGEKLYGDGVNIAARIEGLADPGGVCISRGAYDHIRNKLKLGYEYIGKHNVKNIKNPVRVYKILTDPSDIGKLIGEKPVLKINKLYIAVAAVALVFIGLITATQFPSRKVQPPVDSVDLGLAVFPTNDKPSIAVLPFDNMSGDPEQQYLCDGIAEQIITSLSQGPYLYVVSRTSSFAFKGKSLTAKEISEKLNVRYLLEGSVQENADQIRINVQLIDGRSENHIWAEHYDRSREDLFAVQDEITMKILAILNIEVTGFKTANLNNVRPSNLKAYINFLKGTYFHLGRRPEDIEKARSAFNEAIGQDPNFAKAYVLLGLVDLDEITFRRTKTPEKYLQSAKDLAQKAMELDPDNPPYALWNYIYRSEHDYEKAVYHGKKCVEQAPNDPYRYHFLTQAQRFAGEYSDAVVSAKTALKLTPFRPAHFLNNLAWSYVYTQQYPKAIAVFEEVIEKSEKSLYGSLAYLGLSAVYELTGNHEKASWAVEIAMKRNPEFTLEGLRKAYKTKDTSEKEMVFDAWRKAGLPESSIPPVPEKPSIAVLPFNNMSDDPEQEYFSDGMTDDIITDLSKISGLMVISSSSTITYKGKEIKLPVIAKELGVRYVLEGSVRRAGNEVRINAQLIDAVTDHHVWADRFDDKYENIFALQDKITERIVSALAVKLSASEQEIRTERGTKNLVAYDTFLKGISHMRKFTPKDYVKAIEYFEKAIKLDPNYSEAYANLAYTYLSALQGGRTFWKEIGKGFSHCRILARHNVEKAMKHPTSRSYQVMAEMELYKRNFREAIDNAEYAVSISPNDADALYKLGRIMLFIGKPEEAIKNFKRSIMLDPLHKSTYGIASAYFNMKNYEQAVKFSEKAIKDYPEKYSQNSILAAANAYLGNDIKAKKAFEEFYQ